MTHFNAQGKPMVTWQRARFVLARARAPRDCVSCHEPLDTEAFVYLGKSGRAPCQACARTITAFAPPEQP